jgi:hypothetical protein
MSGDSKQQLSAALQALQLPEGKGETSTTVKAHLDFLLVGLESLGDEGSEAMLEAAKALKVNTLIGDRVTLWRLRNANPLRKSDGGRKKVDIDEIRALVLIVCYLARKHQSDIRATLERLEVCVAEERSPVQEPLLGDYLDAFHANYRDRMVDGSTRVQDDISQLGLSLLVELLFYGSQFGPERLWNGLLARPDLTLPPSPEEAAISPPQDVPVSEI